jgi:hypothetical protein
MIDLISIYDSLISQPDASLNSIRMLVFWPDLWMANLIPTVKYMHSPSLTCSYVYAQVQAVQNEYHVALLCVHGFSPTCKTSRMQVVWCE